MLKKKYMGRTGKRMRKKKPFPGVPLKMQVWLKRNVPCVLTELSVRGQ